MTQRSLEAIVAIYCYEKKKTTDIFLKGGRMVLWLEAETMKLNRSVVK